MKVYSITPRGYCLGVVNAIQTVKKLAKENHKEPLYLLGMLVHNQYVIEAIRALGVEIIPRDQLASVLENGPKGKIILSAHGSSQKLVDQITSHGFSVVDTVCKDVVHNMDLIRHEIDLGHEIIFLGKHGHPEAEATVAINFEKVHLIEKISEIAHLKLRDPSPFLTNQTTLSMLDVFELHQQILKSYPNARPSVDLCNATQQRQEAVMKLPQEVDLVLVVGDPKSNNSNMLTKIAQQQGKKALLVSFIDEVPLDLLKQFSYVAVTAGASTPSYITQQIIGWLSQLDWTKPETLQKPTFDLSKVI